MFEFDSLTSSGSVLVIVALLLALMVVGWLSSRNLSEPERRVRIRKFGAVGVAALFWWVLISDPFISSYSGLSDRDYQEPANLETNQAVAKQFLEQHRRLERLEEEAVKLREDLYKLHRHHSILVLLVVVIGSNLIISQAFGKKVQEPEDDIQTLNL